MSAEPYCSLYGDYVGRGPVFYTRADCPWLDDIEPHWRTIRGEFEEYRYHRQQKIAESYVPDRDIQGLLTVNFVSYLYWYPQNCLPFPKTIALLRSIPHLTSAFINLLLPHCQLPVHNGETDAIYRCHLPLIVPGEVDEVGIEVRGERVGWREGKAFAFEEAYRHHAWNNTERDRVILVFDVLKPQFHSRKIFVCGDVLGGLTLRMLETKLPALRRVGPKARRGLHRVLRRAASGLLMVHNRAPSTSMPLSSARASTPALPSDQIP